MVMQGFANGLQLALIAITLLCVRLQRRCFPLLDVCPVHGFITEPWATVPSGRARPSCRNHCSSWASAETGE